jgi:hypothetical protein
VLSTAAGMIGAFTFSAGMRMRTGCSCTCWVRPCRVASLVPRPVEVGFGFGLGVSFGVGVGERVGSEAEGAGEDVVAETLGVTCALGDFFFEEPPKPRMTAKAATATTIAV